MNYIKKNLNLINGVYQKNSSLETTKIIENFYKTKPFPNYKKKDNKNSILNTGDKNYIAKKIKNHFKFNKKILEVGSGTCQLSNYLSIGTNNEIVAMDTTLESLKLGKKFSDQNSIKNINYVKADLFDDIFEENVFDLVWCSGVLHHTNEPYNGFKNILRYVKKDGYIIIGLYNNIFRIKTILRKYLFKIFGKKLLMIFDPHLRKIKGETEKINSWINDQYQHPVESLHSIDEILKWFETNDVEFVSSIPSFGKNSNKDIFEIHDKGDKISRFLSQLFSIFTPLADEGGLFIVVGKKIIST